MKNQDPVALDWKTYEDITKYIYEMLGSKFGVKIIGHGNNFKVQGKSGIKHQIDVLTEQLSDGKPYRTAIECKFIKKKVTKEIVMKLFSEIKDADIDAGIIVCKAGYTNDTMKYAEHMGIKLVTLQEAIEDGCNDSNQVQMGIVNFNLRVTLTRPIIVSIDFGSFSISDTSEILNLYYENYAIIVASDGKIAPVMKYIRKHFDVLRNGNQLWKTVVQDFADVKGKLIRAGHNDQPIDKMTFTGFLSKSNEHSTKAFDIVDQVWMIMEEIFDKNAYKLTKSGIVFKDNLH